MGPLFGRAKYSTDAVNGLIQEHRGQLNTSYGVGVVDSGL